MNKRGVEGCSVLVCMTRGQKPHSAPTWILERSPCVVRAPVVVVATAAADLGVGPVACCCLLPGGS